MLSSLLVVTIILVIISGEEWNDLGKGPWHAREGLMGTFFDGYIWMSGGRYSPSSHSQPSIFYNDVWKLNASCISNVTSCQWQPVIQSAPWEGRAYHIMFTHTVDSINYMYIIGGQNLTTFYNDIWRTINGYNWTQVLGNDMGQFHRRAGLAAISYPKDGMIYVSSGCFNETPNRITYNDLWRSKVEDGSEWELVIKDDKNIAMHTRSGPRIQIWQNYLYIVAGEYGFTEYTQLNDVWKIDLDTIDTNNINNIEWDLVVANANFTKRSGHGFVIDNKGIFWVVAGYLDLHDLWMSNDTGLIWHCVDTNVFNCDPSNKQCGIADNQCGRYDFWAQLDDKNDLFLYGGDSSWSTFGGEWNQTFEHNLDTYPDPYHK